VVAAKAAAEDSKPVRGGGGWTGDVCRVKAVRVRASQIGSAGGPVSGNFYSSRTSSLNRSPELIFSLIGPFSGPHMLCP